MTTTSATSTGKIFWRFFGNMSSKWFRSATISTSLGPSDGPTLSIADHFHALKKAYVLGWVSLAHSKPSEIELFSAEIQIIPGELVFLTKQCFGLPSHPGLGTLILLSEIENEDKDRCDELESCNIRRICCDFDGDIPPPGVVNVFLHTMHTAGGRAAVLYCNGQRGRTSLFCAIYLMHTHGFAARTAMAWLRIACPGPVGRIAASHAEFLLHLDSAVLSRPPGVDANTAFRRGAYRWWRMYMDWVLGEGGEVTPRARPQSALPDPTGSPLLLRGLAVDAATLLDSGGGPFRQPESGVPSGRSSAPLTTVPRMVSVMD
jgi:hypothetical protein